MYSLMSKRRNGTPSALASCLASSVLPTPVGPMNRNEPTGRVAPESPACARCTARTTTATASSCANTTFLQIGLEVLEPRAIARRRARDRDARHARDRRLDVATRRRSCASSPLAQLHRRAGLVDHVDRLVGQEAVGACAWPRARRARAARASCSARRGAPRSAARRPSRICTVSSTDGSCTSTRWKRRASARSRSKWRNSRYVVEPMQRSSPDWSSGFSRFDASTVAPDAAPAPRMVWISSMNRIGFGRCWIACDQRLEARLEVAAVARAREQRADVEREDLGARAGRRARRPRRCAARAPRRSRSCRRPSRRRRSGCSCGGARGCGPRARSRRRGRPADRACRRAARSVRFGREGRERIGGTLASSSPRAGRRGASARAPAGLARRARRASRSPCEMYLQHVEPRDALRAQQRDRVRVGLLEDRGEQIARLDLVLLRALGVRERVLDHAVEGERLERLVRVVALARPRRRRSAASVDFSAQVAPQWRSTSSPRSSWQEREEQVLDGHVGVAARDASRSAAWIVSCSSRPISLIPSPRPRAADSRAPRRAGAPSRPSSRRPRARRRPPTPIPLRWICSISSVAADGLF